MSSSTVVKLSARSIHAGNEPTVPSGKRQSTYGIEFCRDIKRARRARLYVIPMFRPEVVITPNGPAVAHSNDFSLVSSAKPATAGEILSLFATGLGPTRASLAPGQPFHLGINGQAVNIPRSLGTPGNSPRLILRAIKVKRTRYIFEPIGRDARAGEYARYVNAFGWSSFCRLEENNSIKCPGYGLREEEF